VNESVRPSTNTVDSIIRSNNDTVRNVLNLKNNSLSARGSDGVAVMTSASISTKPSTSNSNTINHHTVTATPAPPPASPTTTGTTIHSSVSTANPTSSIITITPINTGDSVKSLK